MSRRNIKIWVASTAIVVLSVAAYGFTHTRQYAALCETFGGKWASATATCVTRSCYKDGACGDWTHPAARCDRLKTGDSIAEVYFQLGQLERVDGNRYFWQAMKGGSDLIVAVIENEKLKSLACPA